MVNYHSLGILCFVTHSRCTETSYMGISKYFSQVTDRNTLHLYQHCSATSLFQPVSHLEPQSSLSCMVSMMVHIEASLQLNRSLVKKSSLVHAVALPIHVPMGTTLVIFAIWTKLDLSGFAQVAKFGRGSLWPTYFPLTCILSIIYTRQCQNYSFTEPVFIWLTKDTKNSEKIMFQNLEGWVEENSKGLLSSLRFAMFASPGGQVHRMTLK